MSTFSTQIRVDASPEEVWQVLADIGNIHLWNPGVENSYLTGEVSQGTGAARYCDLGGGNYLDERAVVWEPHRALTMRIDGTNLPFKSADVRFTLWREGDETIVQVSPIYVLKYGMVGKFLDAMYVRRTYQKGMEELLQGLKNYVNQTVHQREGTGIT